MRLLQAQALTTLQEFQKQDFEGLFRYFVIGSQGLEDLIGKSYFVIGSRGLEDLIGKSYFVIGSRGLEDLIGKSYFVIGYARS